MNRLELERAMLGQPVRSLQYMLNRLAQEYDFLRSLSIDGIFGEETLEAVMLFQRELHPPVTGIVDRGTWQAIRERWLAAEEHRQLPRQLRVLSEYGEPLQPGEEGEWLILPQTMVNLLSRYIEGFEEGEASGVHDPHTVENIKRLQRAAGLEETGLLDRRTWDKLARLYELFITRRKQPGQSDFPGGWG